LICPFCKSGSSRRSRRRSLADYALGLAGLRPWRCGVCERRFYAWSVPPRYIFYAHCMRCGNLDLSYIGREYVTEGPLRWLWHILRVPAVRCQPCRRKFFALRPLAPPLPRSFPAPPLQPESAPERAPSTDD